MEEAADERDSRANLIAIIYPLAMELAPLIKIEL